MIKTMLDAVQFLRFAEGGRVHVYDHHVVLDGLPPLYAAQRAICGRTGRPGQLHGIDRFPDRDLCARCWAGYPPDRRHELFQHPEDPQ